jgi:hypothetical protein
MTSAQIQWLTMAFIVAVAAVVIGYDILIVQAYGTEASISRVIRRLIERHPTVFVAIVFAAGVFVGHIWLPTIPGE